MPVLEWLMPEKRIIGRTVNLWTLCNCGEEEMSYYPIYNSLNYFHLILFSETLNSKTRPQFFSSTPRLSVCWLFNSIIYFLLENNKTYDIFLRKIQVYMLY